MPDQSVTFGVFVIVNGHFVTPLSNNCSWPIFFQSNFKIKESLSNECAAIAPLISRERYGKAVLSVHIIENNQRMSH